MMMKIITVVIITFVFVYFSPTIPKAWFSSQSHDYHLNPIIATMRYFKRPAVNFSTTPPPCFPQLSCRSIKRPLKRKSGVLIPHNQIQWSCLLYTRCLCSSVRTRPKMSTESKRRNTTKGSQQMSANQTSSCEETGSAKKIVQQFCRIFLNSIKSWKRYPQQNTAVLKLF